MRQLDFYEFAGILLPGVIVSAGLCLLFPALRDNVITKDMSLGSFGLFAMIAYAAGHVLQTVGNFIEALWWRGWRGWPTDWIRSGRHSLLAPEQAAALRKRLPSRLDIPELTATSELGAEAWYSITRQIYAATSAAARTSRVDVFNGNYGLNRGVAASVLVLAVSLVLARPQSWRIILVALLMCLASSLWRMHRFAKYYARELFVEFLQLPTAENAKAGL